MPINENMRIIQNINESINYKSYLTQYPAYKMHFVELNKRGWNLSCWEKELKQPFFLKDRKPNKSDFCV
jgi:hypothetical protein